MVGAGMSRKMWIQPVRLLLVASAAWGGCVRPGQQPVDVADRGTGDSSVPRPASLPPGWVTYELGPDGRVRTPFPNLTIRTAPVVYHELSAGARRIAHWEFGRGAPTTLVLGGMHGGEYTPALLCFRFIRWLEDHPGAIRFGRVVVAPLVDPDGLESGVRGNANGVDLNRNYPASNFSGSARHGIKPASEPETRFVLMLLNRYRPSCVVSVHAALACVNYDGPAAELAEAMSRACGLPVTPSVGYPTPGSFGSYAGLDLELPTITLELRSKQTLQPDFNACRDALMAAHEYATARLR